MYKKVTNPIAMQSQKQLCETMLDLLTTLPFDDITITLLCQEAHLVRKTFYRNFETKEDVLICMLDYHLLEYISELAANTQNMRQFITHFFNFWQEKYGYLKTLQEKALFYLLNRLYLHYIEEIHSVLTTSSLDAFYGKDSVPVVFYIGGMCNVLGLWISNECNPIMDQFLPMILPPQAITS